MGYRVNAIWLLVFWVSSTTNGLPSTIPHDKEVVFEYNAVVKVGTTIEHKYDSAFFLIAKLHVQSPKDELLIAQLKDVSFKLYNGEAGYGFEHYLKTLPLPDEASDLTKPFKILYNNGQAKAIVTDKKMKPFARNMQKAIASMLQLKEDSIEWKSELPHGFVTEEMTIYGQSQTVYNVLHQKGKLVVQKMHDMKSTKHMYHTVITNVVPDYCEANYEEPISHDSQQVYVFKKDGDKLALQKIESTGGFYFYPFRAKSSVHYTHATITLKWHSEEPVSTPLRVENEFTEHSLRYDMDDPNHEGEIPDILSVSHNLDYTKLMTTLQEMMTDLFDYLHLNSLDIHTIDIRKQYLVSQMVKLLMPVKLEELKKMHNELSSKTTEKERKRLAMFNQLLPLLGTHASIVLTTQIVREKKVENEVALKMVQSISSYIQLPTEQLLKDTEHMLSWGDDIDISVRRAAILNFAIIIQKTYMHQKNLLNLHEAHTDEKHTYRHQGVHEFAFVSEKLRKFLDNHPVYEKYINEFGAKLKAATDIPTQILYAQALNNCKMPLSLPHLIAIITGKITVHHDVRETAMFAGSYILAGNHEMIAELYWPIFSDWTQHTELRIIAYAVLMASHPPVSRLLNIFWEMQNEPNTELYSYHYSYLQAIARTTDPCRQVFRMNVKQILSYTRKPSQQGLSHYYQMDFVNEKYGFGAEINVGYVVAERTRMIGIEMISQIANVRRNPYSLFVKIGGLGQTLSKSAELNLKESIGLLNYEKLLKAIKDIPNLKGVEIQLIVAKNFNVVQYHHFNEQNIKDMYEMFAAIMKDQFSKSRKSLELEYEIVTQMFMPTEIGMPVYMEVVMPVITHRHMNIKTDMVNEVKTFHIDDLYHVSKNANWGLTLYNPIVNAHQGVLRAHSLDLVVPILADISITTNPFTFKLSWKTRPERERNVIGVRSHAVNFVFTLENSEHGYLGKSCEKCLTWHPITKGELHRHNETLFFKKGTVTGFSSKAVVFDSEGYGNDKPINKLAGENGFKSSGRFMEYISLMFHHHYHGLTMPTPYMRGYLITLYPTTDLPVTQMDLNLRIVSKLEQTKNEFLPAMKLVPRLTYTLKNNDKPIKTWDINVNMDLNTGHTLQNTKIEITRIIPEKKDYKICYDCIKEWKIDEVNSHTRISMGQSAEGTCNNDTTVDIVMTGRQTVEQKSPFHQYEICDLFSHDLGPDYHSIRCAEAHTSIRKYDYDIKMHNMQSEYMNMMRDTISSLWKMYNPYHRYTATHEPTPLGDNTYKAQVEYLITDDVVNVKLMETDHTYELIGLPAHAASLITSHPDNTHYSKLYMLMSNIGMGNTCTVGDGKIQHEFNEEAKIQDFPVDLEWKLVIGDSEKDATNGVFVRKSGAQSRTMALKVVHSKETLEVKTSGMHEEKFVILVNNKEVSQVSDNYNEDWFNYVIRSNIHTVVITTFKFKMHMEFTGEELVVQVPNVDGIDYYGPCAHEN